MKRKIIILVAIGFLSIAAFGASSYLGNQTTAEQGELALGNPRIVYLAPSKLAAVSDTPGSIAEWRNQGVTVVHDFGSLKAEINTAPADAIILHKESLPQVNNKWLAAEYKRGTLIGGINIRMSELSEIVGDPEIMNSPWDDAFYKPPFYTYAGKLTAADPKSVAESQKSGLFAGTTAQGRNNLTSKTLSPMLFELKLAIKDIHARK